MIGDESCFFGMILLISMFIFGRVFSILAQRSSVNAIKLSHSGSHAPAWGQVRTLQRPVRRRDAARPPDTPTQSVGARRPRGDRGAGAYRHHAPHRPFRAACPGLGPINASRLGASKIPSSHPSNGTIAAASRRCTAHRGSTPNRCVNKGFRLSALPLA